MQHEPNGVDDARLIAVTYHFLEPVRVRVRRPDGLETLIGYGMGEQIQVLEPSLVTLQTSRGLRSEIPLANGSTIIEYPADMKTQRHY